MPSHTGTVYVERQEERIKPKKRELHELPYKEIIKYRTVRLASEFVGMEYGLWRDEYEG